jgi:hypothetical protein
MATFSKVSRLIRSAERSALITDVVDDDQIDIESILGRPARGVKIIPDDASDTITLRLNNKIRIPAMGDNRDSLVYRDIPSDAASVVSKGSHQSVFTITGDTVYYIQEGLSVSFIEIASLTFGAGGTSISIEVW